MARQPKSTEAPIQEPEAPISYEGFVDVATHQLAGLAKSYQDIQQARVRLSNRSLYGRALGVLEESIAAMEREEHNLDRALQKALRDHPMYDWLHQFKGFGGPLTARLLAIIGDPRRFPGQQCSRAGEDDSGNRLGAHYHAPIHDVGVPCTAEEMDAEGNFVECGQPMLAPRTTTGVRSIWHYFGLHVTPEGKTPRRTRGQQADWNPAARTIIMMPNVGLAAQIIRHRPQPYRRIYDEVKARKLAAGMEKGAHGIALKVAAKAFLGDLLVEWKRLLAA